MWIDKLLELSDSQSITSTGPTTNVIDLGSDRDIGPGKTVWVVLQVDVAVGGTSPTYDFDIQTDTVVGFGSPTVIGSFPQITNVNGVAGAQFVLAVPYGNEQFLRLNATVGGTSPTGTFSAWVTDQEPESWQAYPDATN